MTFDDFINGKGIDEYEYNLAEDAWNEARRTDPVKQQLLEALRQISGWIYLPGDDADEHLKGICSFAKDVLDAEVK